MIIGSKVECPVCSSFVPFGFIYEDEKSVEDCPPDGAAEFWDIPLVQCYCGYVIPPDQVKAAARDEKEMLDFEYRQHKQH